MNAIDGPGYMWLGPHAHEARAAFHRARKAGMKPLRAMVIGCVASFRDAWAFRLRIAEKVGCSVRTVQRALNQGRELGLIEVFRAKKGEIPKGRTKPLKCGWSHRITVGFGKAAAVVEAAVAACRIRWELRKVLPVSTPPKLQASADNARLSARVADPAVLAPKPRTANQLRSWTAAELDAELERIERAKAALYGPPK